MQKVPHKFNYGLMKKLNDGKQMTDVWRMPAIAKYRNEQKSARFHIVTYIIKANAQLLDFQSNFNLERVSFINYCLLTSRTTIGSDNFFNF